MLVPRIAGPVAARRPRPARPAALLLLDQPGRSPGHRPAPDHRADPDLTDLRRPGALRDHDAGRDGRQTLTHRPTRRTTATRTTAPGRARPPAPGTRGRPTPPRSTPPSSAPCCTGTAGGGAAEPPDATAAGPRRDRPRRRHQPARAREPGLPRQRRPARRGAHRPRPAAARPPRARCWSASTVPSDEIRWWRDVPTGPARAPPPGPSQEQLRSAARQMLLAGALATRARAGLLRRPPPAHRRRVPGRASSSAPHPAAAGLTAFVPVGTRPRRSPYACTTPCTPPARPSTTSGPPAAWTPSTRAVEAGVSRELTEALIALVRGYGGRPHRASSGRRRPGSPTGVRAPARAGRVLARRPARAARGRRPLPARRALRAGADHRRGGPDAPVGAARATGTVRLRVLAGRRGPARPGRRWTRSRTGSPGHAHLVGLPIRVHGRLESRGGFRRLTDAADVRRCRSTRPSGTG